MKKNFKKWILGSFIFFSAFGTNAFAQSDALLQQIANNTQAIMQSVSNLPAYIQQATAFILMWTNTDSSDTSKNLGQAFQDYQTSISANYKAQASTTIQQRLLKDFFGDATPSTFIDANDVVYQIFPMQPQKFLYFNPDPRATNQQSAPDYAYNYLRYASGLNVSHIKPEPAWNGKKTQKDRYNAYYYSISAVQTYNAYALSNLYANYNNGDNLSKTQQALITQASSSDWFTQVGGENISVVVRQILMYESQIYVLLSHMYNLEKQMLTAQTMNNTLLILLNQYNEDVMVKKADGTIRD